VNVSDWRTDRLPDHFSYTVAKGGLDTSPGAAEALAPRIE